MRLRLLSLFLALQLISFGIWKVTLGKDLIPETVASDQAIQRVYPTSPSPSLASAAAEADDAFVYPYISVQNMADEEAFLNTIRQQQIRSTFSALPKDHAASVKNLILDFNPDVHRGFGGNQMIIIRATGVSSQEFVGVLVHELAHNVDYATLIPTKTNRKSPFKDGQEALYETDPSLDFYRLSWLKTDYMKSTATNMDFVSGYAMVDPFEDFAETYNYYVLHYNDFVTLAKTSPVLQAKFDFMRDRVFEGQAFDTDDGFVNIALRVFDTTVLPYDLEDFLG